LKAPSTSQKIRGWEQKERKNPKPPPVIRMVREPSIVRKFN